MSVNQIIITVLLVAAVVLWVTKWVDRTIVSAGLLVGFCIFGQTPLQKVFSFPLSETFIIIVLAFVFSEGVKNSNILSRLVYPLLCRMATSLGRLLISFVVVNAVMIFIIPQPFARIILVAMIYAEFFDKMNMPKEMRDPLMFLLHMSAVCINMTMIRGDIILNNCLLSVSGDAMSEAEWMRYMTVPSIVFTILFLFIGWLVFRRNFHAYPKTPLAEKPVWTKKDIINLVYILVVLIMWILEDVHGISGTIIVAIGTLLMFPLKLLKPKDLKCIDVKLLVFLTAAFSIGSVMKASGTADVIFSRFSTVFPQNFSVWYLLIIAVVTMVMHMILGSSVTTMSVVIPGLMVIAGNTVPLPMMLFTIYIIGSSHAIFPFHNVITMIGEGRKNFSSGTQTKFGLIFTIPVILIVLTVFYGWWCLVS